MRVALRLLAAALLLPLAPLRAGERVRLETEHGAIVLELDARAAKTVENFLRYVDGGFYDGGEFHRTVTTEPDNQPGKAVKIDVIQGGMDRAREAQSFPPIALERTSATGVRHLDGTVSMARDGPDSATADFFICVGAQPELDFAGQRNPDGQGFAAFARVVEGMDVVRKIHRAPASGQVLDPRIKILRARRQPAPPPG